MVQSQIVGCYTEFNSEAAAMKFERISLPSRTIEAAVSSQVVSIPRTNIRRYYPSGDDSNAPATKTQIFLRSLRYI